VLGNIPLRYQALLMAVHSTSGCLYAGNPAADRVTVIDAAGRREIDWIDVGRKPAAVAVDQTRNQVYVANEDGNTVSVLAGTNCQSVVPTASPSPTASATASPTASSTASPTTTPTASATPSPHATPSLAPQPTSTAQPCICQRLRRIVPSAVINDALAQPERYRGWLERLNPARPPGPDNPVRTCLGLLNPNLGWHPLYNPPQWQVGCR
jgi:YVTN family beta-propeller protein